MAMGEAGTSWEGSMAESRESNTAATVRLAAEKLRVSDLKAVMSELGLPKPKTKPELVDHAVRAANGGFTFSHNVTVDSTVSAIQRTCESTGRGRGIAAALSRSSHYSSMPTHCWRTMQPQAPNCAAARTTGKPTSQAHSQQSASTLAGSVDERTHMQSLYRHSSDPTLRRVQLADPFYGPPSSAPEIVLPPTPLRQNTGGHDRTIMLDVTFAIPREVMQAKKQGHEIHFCSVLSNDPVRNRMHWPCHAEVRMNNMLMHVPNRSRQHPLGNNARDPPAIANPMANERSNRLIVRGKDNRNFIGLLRLTRRRSYSEVRAMIPASGPMQAFVDRAKTHCSAFDRDEDLVIESNTQVSLACPITGNRARIPCRLRDCQGLAIFDLDNFLQLVQRTRKWLCPHCQKSGDPSSLIIDTFLLSLVRQLDDEGLSDVKHIELDYDGNWRPMQFDGTQNPMRSPTALPERHHDPSVDLPPSFQPKADPEASSQETRPPDVNMSDRCNASEPEVIVLDCDDNENTGVETPSAPEQQKQQQQHQHPSEQQQQQQANNLQTCLQNQQQQQQQQQLEGIFPLPNEIQQPDDSFCLIRNNESDGGTSRLPGVQDGQEHQNERLPLSGTEDLPSILDEPQDDDKLHSKFIDAVAALEARANAERQQRQQETEHDQHQQQQQQYQQPPAYFTFPNNLHGTAQNYEQQFGSSSATQVHLSRR